LKIDARVLTGLVWIEAEVMYVMKAIRHGLIPEKIPAEITAAAMLRSKFGVMAEKLVPAGLDADIVFNALSRLAIVRFSP
jgi:hypothetical protein